VIWRMIFMSRPSLKFGTHSITFFIVMVFKQRPQTPKGL
jgi:hypothetical protein